MVNWTTFQTPPYNYIVGMLTSISLVGFFLLIAWLVGKHIDKKKQENLDKEEMTFKKYPDIERLGHDDNRNIFLFQDDTIVVEEKVDGGNGSFWLENDGIHLGSRSRDLTKEGDEKIFARQQEKLRTHLAILEKNGVKIKEDYIYYIEWMAPHTINYTNAPDFIGIDIRLKRRKALGDSKRGFGMFLGREAREQEYDRLKIENVPVIWRGTVREFRKKKVEDFIPTSKYYPGKAEGIVIKNYCRKHPTGFHQLYAKVVTDEFKEDNKAIFGGIRQKQSDTNKIFQRFCTDARIRKAINVLINEYNHELDKSLMKALPHYVIKDILKEEFSDIFKDYKFLDFKELKNSVSKACFRVLNEEIAKKT